ncbi:condensation domain-containing protein [Kutzneria sp. NPDC052558]|uniref:condensation domain-containing protein n=1 Tax=Kutzneria sp. NPDC052558 TaxID=3364121 RepID=UPI0037CBA74D
MSDTRTSRRIVFSGASARTGPLSWGQAKMFRDIDDFYGGRALSCLPLTLPVPEGIPLAAVVSALAGLVSAHESLRTRYPEAGRQVVDGSGELVVEVIDSTDPEAASARIVAEFSGEPFDLAAGPPLRCAVILNGGRPVGIACVFTHVAVDGIAVGVLGDDLTDLMLARPKPAVTTWQPLDLAEHERSPAGVRQCAKAVSYLDDAYRRAPFATLAEVGPHEDVPYLRGWLRSTELAQVLAWISERTGRSRSAVLLAAYLALLGLRACGPVCAVSSIAANRMRAETDRYVGQMAQDAVVVVDTATETFDELVRRVWTASLTAYANSPVDPHAQDAVLARVAAERGFGFSRDCVYNDQVIPTSRSEVRLAVGSAVNRLRIVADEFIPVRAYFSVHRLDEIAEISLWADTRFLPRRDLRAFLDGLRRLLAAEAEGGVRTADLGAVCGLDRAC